MGHRTWTGQDGQRKEETQWFNVVTWRKLAETCNQYVTKGRKVYIEGRLQTRSWDGQDGQKHYRTEIVASDMRLLDSRPRPGDAVQGPGEPDVETTDPEDVPF